MLKHESEKMIKPTVLLLDADPDSQHNVAFLLEIARFQLRCCLDESECLNWLSLARGTGEEILAILVGGQLVNEKIRDFFQLLESQGHYLPILVVDRHESVLKKDELLRESCTQLPVYVCAPAEILVMLNHFHVLKTSLAATNRTFQMLFQN